ncbi:glycosyltransferase [Halopiger djelfimassiliensis]|uniref:glycosyltransferase n=1 Tax=Halopiger djelfimassiliensis TaxID=1293047 RepID=UPI000677B252|nr:glycosyltransferase [Halopiger djelfimassiliensis]
MDLVFVSHLFPTPKQPTKGIFVLRQAEALSDRGHHVRVISPVPYVPRPVSRLLNRPSSATIPQRDRYGDVTVYYPRYFSLPRPETLPLVAYSFRRTLRNHRPLFESADLVNAHVAVPDGFAAAPLARSLEIPLVTTIHGADLQHSIHRPFIEPQVETAVASSETVILNSHKLRRIFTSQFDRKHDIEVVHNGIPVQLIAETSPREPDGTSCSVISVGSLTETKGHRYALEAIAKLPERLEYLIVGDGPLRAELEEYATDLGIRADVTFTGSVPHRDVFGYLQSADAFVLPSYEEAFGIAYLEAMACGLPVIACEGEGPADYITDRQTGFLVPPHEPDAIAEVLQELRADPDLRRRVSDRGQRTAINAFSWERNAKAVERIFRDAAEEHGSRKKPARRLRSKP